MYSSLCVTDLFSGRSRVLCQHRADWCQLPVWLWGSGLCWARTPQSLTVSGFFACALKSPDSSLTMVPGIEEELQQLKLRLQEEESVSRTLRERLEESEERLHENEQGHTVQVREVPNFCRFS